MKSPHAYPSTTLPPQHLPYPSDETMYVRKFHLTGPSVGVTDAVVKLSVRYVDGDVIGEPIDTSSTSAADTGNVARYDAAWYQYIYNLSTKGLSVGRWVLGLTCVDGTQYPRVRFSLK